MTSITGGLYRFAPVSSTDMNVSAGKDRCCRSVKEGGDGETVVFLIVLFLTKQYTFRFISAAKGVALVDVPVVAQADDSVERFVSEEWKCAL
ncbi:MAG: hypothetical protein KQH59_14580 [Desulfobulbaceae bacterium]|nr:hypothetical protein [Desulfobulbaceae bacterium]